MKVIGIIFGLVGIVLLALAVFADSGTRNLFHAGSGLVFPRQTSTLCGAIACILVFFTWRSRHSKQGYSPTAYWNQRSGSNRADVRS